MATGKSAGKSVNVLTIVVGLMYAAMGIEGFAQGKSGQAIGHFYNFVSDLFGKAGDSFVVIFGALIFLCALVILLEKFIPQIPSAVTKVAMIILLVIWVLTIIFADFVDGFDSINDFVSFMVWLESFLVHLLVLSATFSVCGGALKK